MAGRISRQPARLLSMLAHVHIADTPAGTSQVGKQPIVKFLRELDWMEYKGFVGLGYEPLATPESGLAWIERMTQRFRRRTARSADGQFGHPTRGRHEQAQLQYLLGGYGSSSRANGRHRPESLSTRRRLPGQRPQDAFYVGNPWRAGNRRQSPFGFRPYEIIRSSIETADLLAGHHHQPWTRERNDRSRDAFPAAIPIAVCRGPAWCPVPSSRRSVEELRAANCLRARPDQEGIRAI